MEFTIKATARGTDSKPNTLRRNGMVPAVMYGHDGTTALSITITAKDAETLVNNASVNNSIVTVQIPERSLNSKALLRKVQKDGMGNKIIHLSFFAVSAQSSLTVTVPIRLKGDAIGVAVNKGNLDQMLNVIELNCKPEAIPESIEIDITSYDLGSSLHVNELVLPEGVEVAGEQDRIVFSISGTAPDATAAETAAEA
jgi:large subunit ribosomal protein L25